MNLNHTHVSIHVSLGQMKAKLSFSRCRLQHLPHNFLQTVIRQLEIIHTGHHRDQVNIRISLCVIKRLLYSGLIEKLMIKNLIYWILFAKNAIYLSHTFSTICIYTHTVNLSMNLNHTRVSIHVCLGQMKAKLSFSQGHLQLLPHNFLRTVIRQLEIIHAGHHRGQVIVRISLGVIERLLDHGQGRGQGLEPPPRAIWGTLSRTARTASSPPCCTQT